MVDHDAKSLFKAGEKKLGTDEDTFIRIFAERSRAHLSAVSNAYHNMYGSSLKKVLSPSKAAILAFIYYNLLVG